MWPGYGDHMGWMGLWWIAGVVLLLLLVWAVARASGFSGPSRTEEPPETILKRRYARGDVDREEFERRLTDLRK
jgi:putative membrane protein